MARNRLLMLRRILNELLLILFGILAWFAVGFAQFNFKSNKSLFNQYSWVKSTFLWKKCLIFVFQQTSEKRGHIESGVTPNKPACKKTLTDYPRIIRENLFSSSKQKVSTAVCWEENPCETVSFIISSVTCFCLCMIL